MGQIQSIDELIGLLLRRRLLIGAVTVFGIVMTFLYVIGKADVFESTAVIQVQSPTVANADATSSAPRENSAQRLQAIQQQLTTREAMLAVIERHGLYANTGLTDDQKVHLLRISLRFETVASAAASGFGQPSEVSALLISATADTRSQAARVANDFAQSILDAGATGQIDRAREALGFYREEEAQLKAQIDALGAEFAAYQSENRDALPAQRELLRIELPGLESELRTLDQSLVGARNERALIERKSNLRATDRRQIDELGAQIDTLAAQGSALEARRAEILGILAKGQDMDRAIGDYQRTLAQLQSQYEVVTRRSADAETDAKLQDRQQGESFTLLERAIEPDYPISGGRRKLAVVGAVASLMLGAIIAFVMDHIRPVLRTRGQLERELDLRPIVAIPEIAPVGRSLRQKIMQDVPKLSDLARRLPETPLAGHGKGKGVGQLNPFQTLMGGITVIVLVGIAAAMT